MRRTKQTQFAVIAEVPLIFTNEVSKDNAN